MLVLSIFHSDPCCMSTSHCCQCNFYNPLIIGQGPSSPVTQPSWPRAPPLFSFDLFWPWNELKCRKKKTTTDFALIFALPFSRTCPSTMPPYAGWISPAPAEGVRCLTENICTLLRSHNYQQWNWWDNQTSGGSRWARVHSPTVGPSLLGLLGFSLAIWV